MTGRVRVAAVVRLQIAPADVAGVDAVSAVARRERRDARAVVVGAERARERRERPLRDAAAADQPPIGARRDDREVGFPAADRAVPVMSSSPRSTRGASASAQRARNGRSASTSTWSRPAGASVGCAIARVRAWLDARRPLVPAGHERLERVAVAAERDDGVVVGALERLEAQQDVGGLPERQAEVGPLERDVAEPDERPAGRLLRARPTPDPAESRAAARAPGRGAACRRARAACRRRTPARAGRL